MVSSSACEEVVWRVVSLASPRLVRRCSACAHTCAFASTDKFRLNAQGRRIDVWLLYRCTLCGDTWKREILSRVPAEQIGADLHLRLLRNDPEEARRRAADSGGHAVEGGGGASIERPPGPIDAPLRIRLEVPSACDLRLDRLLAAELGVSRNALAAWCERGLLLISPGGARSLRRPARHDTVIELRRSP